MNYGMRVLACGLTVFVAQHGWAADTLLGGFGQTQLQQDTGDAVQKTCGGFVAEGANADEIPLFFTCRARATRSWSVSP